MDTLVYTICACVHQPVFYTSVLGAIGAHKVFQKTAGLVLAR